MSSHKGQPEDAQLIDRALAGRRAEMNQLVSRLLPVIRRRALKILNRSARSGRRDSADDMVQEVWLSLIGEGGRKLRAFDADRGTLEDFVGRLTEREVIDRWRRSTAEKRGGKAQTADPEAIERVQGGSDPEQKAIGQDLSRRLHAHLQQNLPHKGLLVFRYVFTDGQPPSEAARLMKVNVQVVYNWQHKIRGLARTFLDSGD